MNKINKSPLIWFGGKSYLLDYILPLPEHLKYIDVFGGGASLLLQKPPSKYEIYNDINKRLVNFWFILKEQPDDLIQECLRIGDVDSEELFYQYKEEGFDSLNDAARFLYVNRHSFSGMNNYYYGYNNISHCKGHPPRQKLYVEILDNLYFYSKRLQNIRILNKDFREIIKKHNETKNILYLDPPYIQGGNQYEKGIGGLKWSEQDLNDLIDLCKDNKSKIIFSLDKPIIFDDGEIIEIPRINRTPANGQRQKIIEYLSLNYKRKDYNIHTTKGNQTRLF